MFNIYYINYAKAFEIAMLINNKIYTGITEEKGTTVQGDINGNLDLSGLGKIPGLNSILPTIELNGDVTGNKTKKVIDTVQVVSTKSVILNEIYKKAKEVNILKDSKPGSLVKIKDVPLCVSNRDDVMAVKALMSGLVKQVPVEDLGNMDLTSLMEVIFKDSAYILCGQIMIDESKVEHLMLKIPMSAENEMESQYSISDIEIGNVTVLGIYRGAYAKSDLEIKINRLMQLDNMEKCEEKQPTDFGLDIEDGAYEDEQKSEGEEVDGNVHYIDVIAVIQEIHI